MSRGESEETDNPAGLGVEPDLPESGTGAETRHRLHITENGVQEARACGETNGANRNGEAWKEVLSRLSQKNCQSAYHLGRS